MACEIVSDKNKIYLASNSDFGLRGPTSREAAACISPGRQPGVTGLEDN